MRSRAAHSTSQASSRGKRVDGANHKPARLAAGRAAEKVAGALRRPRDGEGDAGGRVVGVNAAGKRHASGRLAGVGDAERHELAARDDRGQHGVGRAGHEDEDDAVRRLLDGLEQGVCRRLPKRLHAVEDVDLCLGPHGGERHVGYERADLLDHIPARTLRKDPVDVGVRAMRHADALVAGVAAAGWAHDALGQGKRGLGLARAGGAEEEVGVGEPALPHGGGQEVPHSRLSLDAPERRGNDRLARHGGSRPQGRPPWRERHQCDVRRQRARRRRR